MKGGDSILIWAWFYIIKCQFSRLLKIVCPCLQITKLHDEQLLLLAAAAALDIRTVHAAWAHLMPDYRSVKVKYL